MKMQVGILGGGRWGQALARLVKAAGHEPFIAYKAKKPPHILRSTKNQPKVAEACDLLFVATSASELRGAIQLARPGPGNRVVVAGRGLEPATARWLTDVVQEVSPVVRVGALAGPAPVEEILNGSLCAGVIASPYREVRQLVTSALHSSRYRVYDSDDLVGVELAGALVPVLATVIGLSSSLRGAGVGIHAMVLTRGLEEGTRLARAMGGKAATIGGLAGIGDLVAAQAKPGHPSFKAGVALIGGDRSQGPEQIARALVRMGTTHRVELPLAEGLVAIYDGAHPLDVVQELMGRPPSTETQGD